MIRQRFSALLVLVLAVIQVLGPGLLWAAEQRGIQVDFKDYVVISAISEGMLIAESSGESKVLRFGEAVNVGEELRTGHGTVAEVLIGNRAVVTLGSDSTAQLTQLSPEQITLQVSKGIARVAASADALGERGMVNIQTPTSETKTRGGIVRVMVNAPGESLAQASVGEAKTYLASYSPRTMVAGNDTDADIIQVEEGVAEILGAGPNGQALTVTAGQSVTRQAGQTRLMTDGEQQDTMRAGVLANLDHSNTPTEGVENLVVLQVDQATLLGQALTGAKQTSQDQSPSEDESKGVINGATGLGSTPNSQSNSQSNSQTNTPPNTTLVAQFFGTGSPGSGTGGNPINVSNTGAVDDGGDSPDVVQLSDPSDLFVKGGAGLLLFTERNPKSATLMPGTDPENDNNYIINELSPELSDFVATQEFLLVDGGDKATAAHSGRAPTGTLILRGISGSNKALPIQFVGTGGSGPFGENDGSGTKRPTDRRKELIAANARIAFSRINVSADIALSDFSNRSDGLAFLDPPIGDSGDIESFVDGAVTARSATTGDRTATLAGGVVLDKGTKVSVGTTDATNGYFSGKSGLNAQDKKFNGSLLAVLASQDGGFNPAFVKIQDRALGVLDGSSISGESGSNVALLSVLDSRLTGPNASDPSTGTNGRKMGEIAPVIEVDGTVGARPSIDVTSAVVVRATNVPLPLDRALLDASSPLLTMMNADMKTTSHFADLAGHNGHQSLSASVPGDALVRLDNRSILNVMGNLLNLNNATASVTGRLFSLNDNSRLNLNGGSLFSLTNGSSLNLKADAFGAFGTGNNTLSITNGLCGGAAACGMLVNSANSPFLLPNGTPLKVAGVSQDVVLPDSFNPFVRNSASADAIVNITANDAIFHVDDTSTLTINESVVKAPVQ